MLKVRLISDYSSEQNGAIPVEYVRIDRLVLEIPHAPVATYCEGLWFQGDRGIRTILIDMPARVHVLDDFGKSISHGPFESARIVDGLVHISRADWRPFARLDARSGLWHIGTDATAWPRLVSTAAEDMGPLFT